MGAIQVRITHIFTSSGHDFKGRHGQERLSNGSEAHESVVCEAGRGLQGDRYAEKEDGHKGQVTFFNGEVLREVGEALGLKHVPPDAFRRNVILEGVDVNSALPVVEQALGRVRDADLRYRTEPVDLEIHAALVEAMGRSED